MANEKVWTEAQREAAAGRMYFKKFGVPVEDVGWLAPWGRDKDSDQSRAIDAECELAEAVELLRQSTEGFESGMLVKRLDFIKKRNEFLQRNTGGHDGR